MEAALNLCWMLVAVSLCGACFIAYRQQRLRTGLVSALACCLLLAVVLFPAISMTDDLQSVNLQAEVGLRSVVELLHATLSEPVVLHWTAVFAVMIVSAMCVLALAQLALSEPTPGLVRVGVLRYRPLAVRPPTQASFA